MKLEFLSTLQNQKVKNPLAWGVAALSTGLTLVAFIISINHALVSGDLTNFLTHMVFLGPVAIAFTFIGILVANRHIRNPIGWIFLIEGLLYTVTLVSGIYGDLGSIFSTAGPPPGAALVAWLSSWIWVPTIILPTTFLFLLFPDGRLPSPRWRILFFGAILGLILTTIGQAIHHEPVDGSVVLEGNPFGVMEPTPVLDIINGFGSFLVFLGMAGGVIAFGLRLRRSRGEKRKQMKWLAYAMAMMLIFLVIGATIRSGLPQTPLVEELLIVLTNVVILGIAIGASIAILRYRLYDIDLIINRTLVYGTLTVTVAIFYGIIVSITDYLLRTDNNLAGLLLTVAIAAVLFRPLQTYVQQGADLLISPATGVRATVSTPEVFGEASGIQNTKKEEKDRPYSANHPFIALIFSLVVLAVIYLWLHLVTPFDNGRLQPGSNAITADGLIVTPLEGGPEGFEAGDMVRVVSGRPIEDWLGTRSPKWQAGDSVSYTVVRAGQPTELSVVLGRYPIGQILSEEWGMITFRFSYLLIAAYVFLRRPDSLPARLLLLAAATQVNSSTWSFGAQVSDFVGGTGVWLYFLTTIGGFSLSWIASFHFALVFPRPLPVLERNRRLTPLIYAFPFLFLAAYMAWTGNQAANVLDWMSYWGPPTGFLAAVFLVLTLLVVVRQYLRHKSGVARLQMRWLAFAAILVGGSAALFYFIPPFLNLPALDRNLIGLVGVLFPLAIAIAILRHNMFDIDALLNRTLVYGTLTAVIITLYVLVVGVLGTILQTQGNLLIALASTGLVAILFQPLRDRLQKMVNRFMYGERDEPFEVLARLGQRLESTLSPEMIYPTIVETVSQALKLPYAAVAVWRNGRWETAESYGKPVDDPVVYPLTHRGEVVGQLHVARRSVDEAFNPADERILRNIARQAGAAVHAVQLVADLQQSRRELVTAREEERRRLRRDLHDGLGPQLASQTLTIDAIEKLLVRDPERAQALLQDLKAQSKAAVQDIRRLVYDLRPPALDELGLVGALREGAVRQSHNGLRITVDALPQLPALPAAVEVAAYRVAQEAMTNVVRHAEANVCTVQLALEHSGEGEDLCVEVRDDGRGLPEDFQAGVGFQSMRERASELGGSCRIESSDGGGVCVTAVFPLPRASK